MTDSLFGKPYEDLYLKTEDERITRIGEELQKGKTVAVLVDNEKEKIDRYKRKLKDRFNAVILEQLNGPVMNVVTLKVRMEN